MGPLLSGASYYRILESIRELLDRVQDKDIYLRTSKRGPVTKYVFRFEYKGKNLTTSVRIELIESKSPIIAVEGSIFSNSGDLHADNYSFVPVYRTALIEHSCKVDNRMDSLGRYLGIFNEILEKLRLIITNKKAKNEVPVSDIWEQLFSE